MKHERKVLVIAPGKKTRGGITAVLHLHRTMDAWEGWKCHWLETHIDRGPVMKLLYFLQALFRYPFLLARHQIIHIHFSEPVSAIRKMFFFVPALLLHKKTILHFHSFSPETTVNGRFARLYRWMFGKADMVVVLSESWKRVVAPHVNGKIAVIHNPAKMRDTNAEYSRKPYILFAGTLNARKGYDDLLRAFASVHDRYPEWRLVLAGNGESEKAKLLAQELGISTRVDMPGWVSGEKKETLFRQASVFCLPSHAEGFPMAVIDAMSYNIPVITTPVGGITDIFTDGEHLLLVSPGDPAMVSVALKRMMNDAALRRRLALRAAGELRACFDLRSVDRQLSDLYESLSTEFVKAETTV